MTVEPTDEDFAAFDVFYGSATNIKGLLRGLRLAVDHLREVSYNPHLVRNSDVVMEVTDAILQIKKLSEFLGQPIEWPKVVKDSSVEKGFQKALLKVVRGK